MCQLWAALIMVAVTLVGVRLAFEAKVSRQRRRQYEKNQMLCQLQDGDYQELINVLEQVGILTRNGQEVTSINLMTKCFGFSISALAPCIGSVLHNEQRIRLCDMVAEQLLSDYNTDDRLDFLEQASLRHGGVRKDLDRAIESVLAERSMTEQVDQREKAIAAGLRACGAKPISRKMRL